MSTDRHRFERMVRLHHDAVLAYAMRRAAPDDAADVVADTFLVAWRRFEDAPDGAHLPWLYAIARRTIANQRRAAARRAALADRLVATPSVSEELDRSLSHALAALAESDREVLLLVAWEGLTSREAARALGCREATFRMRFCRARRRLAALLHASDAFPRSLQSAERSL